MSSRSTLKSGSPGVVHRTLTLDRTLTILVLHAFQKKSPEGIATATRDVDLILSLEFVQMLATRFIPFGVSEISLASLPNCCAMKRKLQKRYLVYI
jgi:hypothetical protein